MLRSLLFFFLFLVFLVIWLLGYALLDLHSSDVGKVAADAFVVSEVGVHTAKVSGVLSLLWVGGQKLRDPPPLEINKSLLRWNET